ncbi:hypothetical protein V495_01861 [Pseudogymnoascus sp. VKM F-4514 (FW-929)]|nr:hypothetical protein V495_01861 [Pseudogymnoascus sp. VKM F-4514 (FW-929)]KFY62336.1 hypothetical protein V497_02457 [Pseudogymnoascus sp. VKM F-4516 (FW-969)]
MAETRVPLFLSVDILMTVLALAVVALRVGYRRAKHALTLSDYMICCAMITSLIHMILDIIICTKFGYARHQKDLPPDLKGSYKTMILFWLIQIFTKFPLMFSKLSLSLVYHDLLSTADIPVVLACRIANYITMVVVVGFFTAATFVGIFACQPIHKSWHQKEHGHCIDTQIMFNYVTSSINILTSFALIAIPLPILLRTQHKRIEIKQLIALVMLGLVDTAVSIVRLWMISGFYAVKLDFTYNAIPTHLVIVIEFNITIIAASLVVMRPCFQAIFNMVFTNSQYNSNNISRHTQNQYSRSGYIMSDRDPAAKKRASSEASDDFPSAGIQKTVDIELSSRNISTEDILQPRDRF